MSLLLDALRRHESERNPEPGELRPSFRPPRRTRTWTWLLTAALILNALVLTLLFRDRLLPQEAAGITPLQRHATVPTAPEDAATEPSASPSAGSAAPTTGAVLPPDPEKQMAPATKAIAASAPATDAATSQDIGQAPDRGSEPTSAVTGTVRTVPLERLPLDALPAAARARFPGIVISTHIYSDDPALRAVVANGTRRREGERVRGLTIARIEAEAVVVEFENYLVEIPVFTDW